ncbi:MAG: YchJ family protein [Bdellovibrio sp.]|nr:YchJ family protein [Bdellovibrio sp.]
MSECFCGNTKEFKECCEPYITGTKQPSTAEATMRARYSAYCSCNVDYIKKTQHPKGSEDFDENATREWAQDSTWLGLQILETKNGGPQDQNGVVEFKAKYRHKNIEHTHHECSTFQKEDGVWYFVDGKVFKTPLVQATPKVGRNEPCTCGSGKKYKKCCGQ